MGQGLYIGTIVVVMFIIVIISFIIQKYWKKKKMIKVINELEREKNLLINVPVLNELDKVVALVKNSKLEEKYNNWKLMIDIIEKETIPKVNDMLIEIDFMVQNNTTKSPVLFFIKAGTLFFTRSFLPVIIIKISFINCRNIFR